MIGSRAPRVKDACGAAARPGYRPVPDPGPPAHPHGSSREAGHSQARSRHADGPSKHAWKRAKNHSEQGNQPLDTAPLLQG